LPRVGSRKQKKGASEKDLGYSIVNENSCRQSYTQPNTQSASCAKTTNYAAIDAWIPGIGAFQMTVGKNHEIKGSAREDLANCSHLCITALLPGNHRMILYNTQ
jgi:hypothetical protein